MFPQRKLLYHRGVDDSIGTWVTDYVLAVQCVIFALILLYVRFVIYKDSLPKKYGSTKSTWTFVAIFVAAGIGAFIGGLTHQFLATVEPYNGLEDVFHWVVLWRFAASFTGVVSFAMFVLSEHLVTSERLVRPHQYVLYGYYGFATLISLGLVIHSLWLVSHPTDPWSLSITFVILFVVLFFELITSLVVLIKRFNNSAVAALDDAYETVEKEYSVTNGNDEPSISRKHKRLQQQASLEPLNNNGAPSPGKRWDLLLYFVGTLLFVVGGAIQIILARYFNCSNHEDPASQGCPLPNAFNHNSVLHIFQSFSMLSYFIAEIFSYRHRERLAEIQELST